MRSEDIQFLKDAGAGLDAELRIVEDGRVHCCVGMLATFYFLGGSSVDVRERIASSLDRYLQAVGPEKLVWGADPISKIPQMIAGTNLTDVRAWMRRLGPRDALDLMLHGGQNKDDADPYRVVAAARSLRPSELSYFSFSLPFAWVSARRAGAWSDFVLEQCEILAPLHGYAGLGIIPHVDVDRSDRAMAGVVALGARFAGLEIDLPASHVIYLEQDNRIKGINWLTILDHSWIEKLGGAASLRAALGEGVEWRGFGTGTVIQAGPRPVFGDIHRQEPMPHYKQVARALRPIRIDSVRAIASQYGFNRERSDKWLARFDDGSS